MNKKFSTLLTAGLLVGSASLFNVDAKVVTPKEFKAAIENDVLNVEKLELPEGDLKVELSDNVDITKDNVTTNGHLFIKTKGLTITEASGKQVTFTGRFAIEADDVTINGLNIKHHVANNTGTYSKTAIVVVGKSATITGNTIVCTYESDNMANGITIFPTAVDAAFTVSGNTIKNANVVQDGWTSSGIIIAEALKLPNTDKEEEKSAVLKEFSIGDNTFDKCATDYALVDYTEGDPSDPAYKAAQVTPLVENGTIINAGDILTAINGAVEDATIIFKGTATQLEQALAGQTLEEGANIAVETNDGPMIAGVAQLQPTISSDDAGSFDLVKTPSADEYYLLVRYSEWTGGKGSFIVTVDEDGNPGQIDATGLTAEAAKSDRNLWKMQQTKDTDGDYTFIFTNKLGQKLTANGKSFFHSVGNAPYNNGVVFNMDGAELNLTDENSNQYYKYYGLYKSALHILTAGELSQIEGGGFSITIEPKDLVGNPFAGRLTPMWWDKDNKSFSELGEAAGNTEYYLKNTDDNYIVAKLFGAEGGNKNQAFYVFTTVSEEALKADLAKATKDRTLFGQFMMYYKPTSADDDMLEIKSIESMKVEVLNDNNKLKYAPIGYTNISTTEQKEKTLTASLQSDQHAITIKVGNNVVDPTAFLKKAFYTVTKIDEKEGNTILAVTSCDVKVDPKFVESVGNDLEAQWAITYDEKAATYTFKNREQVGTEWVVNVNALREDDNTKDDIYVIDGVSYQIATVADAKESDGYLWLGDVKNQRYAMGYYVKALEEGEYLWFVGDKEGNISFEKSNDASVATEMKFVDAIKDDKIVVDTVKVVSKITYYDATKKDFATADSVLKVPVYAFTNVDGKNFGYNGKQYVFGAKNADSLTIRVDNGQYNLRLATKSTDGKAIFANDKIYAGASADYLDQTSCVYDDTKNDLFTVEALNRPVYRRLGATIENDGLKDMDVNTVKINRSNDENTYLYENSANRNANNGDPILNFLGETNLADQPENASLAIFVDTAYVRNETTEPLYLLSVRNSFVEGQEAVPCPDHGFDPDCPHWTPATPDHRVGAYLVGLADSTETVEQAMYQGNVRLSFVDATHVGDSLIIDNSKFTGDKKLAKNDTLSFVNAKGEKVENVATFSFRLVDPASPEGDFYIETVNNQYVRIHNSVPVLVSNLDEAATFNIAQTDEAATSNDEISTSEVKVIAGAGQITIAGAAGKKVVVSNILGQVVANTVITSDNATIAAPQGIVVVAVEGEEAVKAIVK